MIIKKCMDMYPAKNIVKYKKERKRKKIQIQIIVIIMKSLMTMVTE